MTRSSFISRLKKGHCYCPTFLSSSRDVSTTQADYRRWKNPLNTFCFFLFSFFFIFPSPVCTAVNMWKGEMARKWDCCLSVAARYWQALTSKATVALWSELENKDICSSFFLSSPSLLQWLLDTLILSTLPNEKFGLFKLDSTWVKISSHAANWRDTRSFTILSCSQLQL